jgi:hypothetical protein
MFVPAGIVTICWDTAAGVMLAKAVNTALNTAAAKILLLRISVFSPSGSGARYGQR